jgi:hypothetical protein
VDISSRLDISGLDLSGLDLSGLDLEDARGVIEAALVEDVGPGDKRRPR